MKTKATYHCKICGTNKEVEMTIGKPENVICKCGYLMSRVTSAPEIAMAQDESVRWASSKMLHSQMPSGQVRTLV